MAFKVALLLDGLTVSHAVKELADWLQQQSDIELCGLILHPAPQTTQRGLTKLWQLAKRQGWYTAISRAVFALASKAEQSVLSRTAFYRERLAFHTLSHPQVVATSPVVSPSGFVYRFNEEDLARIRALQPDLLIRCGNGILKGEVLGAAPCGVLSMHHGDNRVNRGGPAAFWEVLRREPVTGFVVQRLTEELDGGEVLFRGNFSTALTYLMNRVNLYERSNFYLKHTIRAVMDGTACAEEARIYDRPLYRTPQLHETLSYLLKTASFIASKAVRRLLGRRWNWGVAYAFGEWQGAVLWRGKMIANPAGHFLADPFAYKHQQKHYIFMEDYVYAKRKGVISVYVAGKEGARPLGVALEEEYHLSFPFVFNYEGATYMVPEGSAGRDLRLYRCVDFPLGWELASVLLEDVTAADPMIFEHGGRWWMLVTLNPSHCGANDAELHLFSSQSPLGGWKLTPGNPIMVDASRGRNAGLLRKGETIYRVAQRHGFCQYGQGCAVYRVDSLQPYAETHIQDVSAEFFPGIKGAHHLHHDSGLLVFDYCRDEVPQRICKEGAHESGRTSAGVGVSA